MKCAIGFHKPRIKRVKNGSLPATSRLRRKLSSSHSAFFVRFFLGHELSLAMMTLCRVTFRANEARMCWILSSSARMSLVFALLAGLNKDSLSSGLGA